MALQTNYPGADKSQWKPQLGGITMTSISKLLLHTTESSGWPSYPDFAPQLTIDPIKRQVRQHMPLTTSASTLSDPSSTAVRENRDNVLQVEIVGYCDPAFKNNKYYVKNFSKADLDWLAKFVVWVHTTYGVPLTAPTFLPYPSSYGNSRVRMTGVQYDAYKGILGHEHASGNDHGDPGDLDVPYIIKKAKELTAPKSVPPIKLEDGELPTAKDVWEADVVREPTGKDKKNPFWRASSYLAEIWKQNEVLKKQNAEIIALLKAKK